MGENVLVIGRVVAVHASERMVRRIDRDDHDLLRDSPLLVYVHPGRVATVDETDAFPYHLTYKR